VEGARDAILNASELAKIAPKSLRHTGVGQTLDVAASALILPTSLIAIVDPQCVVAVKSDDTAR
jgi:hypothetical protein